MRDRPQAQRGESGDSDSAWVVGRKAVAELLLSCGSASEGGPPARRPERILVSEGAAWAWWLATHAARAREVGAVVQRVPRSALDRVSEGAVHQGVAARVAGAGFVDLDDLLRDAPRPALLVLVDGVEDPRNLGALVRSAAAAGAGGLLLPERRNAGLSPATAKAAAGALERLPVARVKNAARALERLAEEGIWTVGLDASGQGIWSGLDLTRPTCLVVGAEGSGLSRLVRERCDVLAAIPLARGVESLNASVAGAVVLFEAVRQRRLAGAPPP